MAIEKWMDDGNASPRDGNIIDAEVVPRHALLARAVLDRARRGGRLAADKAKDQSREVFPLVRAWVETEKLDAETLRKRLPEKHRDNDDRLQRLRTRRLWGRWAVVGLAVLAVPYCLITQSLGDTATVAALLAGCWIALLVKSRKAARKAPAPAQEPQESPPAPEPAAAPQEDVPIPEPRREPTVSFVKEGFPGPRQPQEDARPADDVTPVPDSEGVSTVSGSTETPLSPAETLDNAADEQWLTSMLRKADALKNGQHIEIYAPLSADGEHAHQVSFRVHGGTAQQVKAKHRAIAAELDVSRNWLDLSQDITEGRVSMWWAESDPLVPHRSPLLDAASWDVWNPAPLGRNRRGDQAMLDLIETSMIFGGMQNFGKTSGMYAAACAYLLDPRTERWLYDFKGGADWAGMVPLCARSQIGATSGNVDAFLSDMGRLRVLIEDRFAKLRELGCAKITPELAASGVMKPLLVVIDELEALFLLLATREDGSQQIKEITETLSIALKRARAAGVVVMFSGQRPAAKEVDTGLRDSAAQRICFHMANDRGSKMVLGDQAGDAGLSAAGLGKAGRAVMVKPDSVDLLQTGYIPLEDFNALCHRVLASRPAEIADRPFLSEEAAVLLAEMGEADRLSLRDVRRILQHRIGEQWAQRPGESEEAYSQRTGRQLGAVGVRRVTGVVLPDGSRGSAVLKSDLLGS